MGDLKKDDLEALKGILHKATKTIEYDSKIFFDGKQYNLRIPAKIAKTLKIDPKKDYVKFTLEIPATMEREPNLKIKLEKWP